MPWLQGFDAGAAEPAEWELSGGLSSLRYSLFCRVVAMCVGEVGRSLGPVVVKEAFILSEIQVPHL